ncbi:hypothetical protein ACXC9Q_03180 [Kribbella sp. CWNU-51]
MNIRLDPPPVPPLTSSQRSQLRNRVMDKSMPGRDHSTRRWVAPVVAVAAVAAVVAGTLVITGRPSSDPGVAGTPSQTPTQAQAPARIGVDLGAVPRGDASRLLSDCTFPRSDKGGVVKILWSRHVRGITRDSTTSVAVALNSRGSHPASARLGYRVCMTRVPPSAKLGAVGSVGIVADQAWTARPTAERGLVTLGGSDTDFTNDLGTLQAWTIYRARSDIARVEARYVLNGKAGEWTKGVVDGGFAYTEVQAHGKFTVGQRLKAEVRAFDAAGKPVPVKG